MRRGPGTTALAESCRLRTSATLCQRCQRAIFICCFQCALRLGVSCQHSVCKKLVMGAPNHSRTERGGNLVPTGLQASPAAPFWLSNVAIRRQISFCGLLIGT